MQSMSLRYFQREGSKALEAEGRQGVAEPVLLTGRDQEYLLLPVQAESRGHLMDLVEGWSAVLALRAGQKRAVAAGLDALSDEEIQREVRATRKGARKKAAPKKSIKPKSAR